MYKKNWNLNKTALDFVKENSKILTINFSFENNINQGVDVLKKNKEYNLIVNKNTKYDIKNISSMLAKGGHFLTEQKGSEDVNYKGDRLNFNLENEYQAFVNENFKVVRYDQFYENGTHEFYILAKKI